MVGKENMEQLSKGKVRLFNPIPEKLIAVPLILSIHFIK